MKYLIGAVGGVVGAIVGGGSGFYLTEIIGALFFPGPAGLLAGMIGIFILIPLGILIGFVLGIIASLKIYFQPKAEDVSKRKNRL